MNAKQGKDFARALEACLLQLGAEHKAQDGARERFDHYPWVLNTPRAGKLHLRIDLDVHGPTVFGTFEDEKRARALTGDSNPFSGKWNFHSPWNPTQEQIDQFQSYVIARLSRVTKPASSGVVTAQESVLA